MIVIVACAARPPADKRLKGAAPRCAREATIINCTGALELHDKKEFRWNGW